MGRIDGEAKLFVFSEAEVPRIYDRNIVESFYMNEHHREVLQGRMRSLFLPPEPEPQPEES